MVSFAAEIAAAIKGEGGINSFFSSSLTDKAHRKCARPCCGSHHSQSDDDHQIAEISARDIKSRIIFGEILG